jgi:hypothetical protein
VLGFKTASSPAVVLILPTVAQTQFLFTTNSDGSLNISQYTGPGGVAIIPDTTNGLPITTIGNGAFFDYNNGHGLNSVIMGTNVTIGSNVTSIGTNEFYDCLSLTSVAIPNSVTNIGDKAFYECASLTNVIIGNSVISFGNYTFQGCVNLTSITIGNDVTSIGTGAFTQCWGISNIVIPNSVINIGSGAFNECQVLTNVTIGSGVTSIGTEAFLDCTSLTSLTIPDSVTNIGCEVFDECTSLTNIVIVSGVTTIGQYRLDDCPRLTAATIGMPSVGNNLFSSIYGPGYAFPDLTSITFLDSVTNIVSGAFVQCGSLTNINIGSGVNSIGTGAFQGLARLLAIDVDPNNASYRSVGGVLFDAGQSTLIQYPLGLRASSYTVPNSVTNIGSAAFEFNFSLRQIYFTGNAPSYGASAFSYVLATVYYLPGTTGWDTTYGGLPTALWLPQPVTNDGSFGVQASGFGFNINWVSGQTVVASTDLVKLAAGANQHAHSRPRLFQRSAMDELSRPLLPSALAVRCSVEPVLNSRATGSMLKRRFPLIS